jgi:alkylation response protein AidB-like acyl-CoA dehydrogenase
MTSPVAERASSVSAQDERQMLDEIGRWLERDVRPQVLELEHRDVYPAAMVEQMKAFGLFGATIAPEYGGLAEKGPGFQTPRRLGKLGYKGIDTAEFALEDYRVPADCLIGGEEGRGLHQALAGLELGRINIAARGVGLA